MMTTYLILFIFYGVELNNYTKQTVKPLTAKLHPLSTRKEIKEEVDFIF